MKNLSERRDLIREIANKTYKCIICLLSDSEKEKQASAHTLKNSIYVKRCFVPRFPGEDFLRGWGSIEKYQTIRSPN